MSITSKPDFIVIGSSRCGTSFIYKYLNQHEDVWLPPVKELHYFGSERQGKRFDKWTKKHIRPLCGQILKSLKKPSRKTFYNFRFAFRYVFRQKNDFWYRTLFESDKYVSGDITPSYCVLSEKEIEHVHKLFPDVKIIFMMRYPIDRLWSSVKKKFGRRMNKDISTLSLTDLKIHFNEWGVSSLTDYVEIIEKWEAVFPKTQIFYGFMDEIEQEPQKFMKRLYSFLAINDRDHKLEDFKIVNDTTAYSKKIPTDVNQYLAKKYLPMNEVLSRKFSPYPQKWYERMQKIISE